jgi:hypothetical protein
VQCFQDAIDVGWRSGNQGTHGLRMASREFMFVEHSMYGPSVDLGSIIYGKSCNTTCVLALDLVIGRLFA